MVKDAHRQTADMLSFVCWETSIGFTDMTINVPWRSRNDESGERERERERRMNIKGRN